MAPKVSPRREVAALCAPSRYPVGVIAIREAAPRDAPALAALRCDFRSGLAPSREEREAFVRRCSAWMSESLSQGWKCWLAARQEEIVGQIWLQLVPKLPNPNGEPERHAYITNLYVKPECRGGVGSRLLRAALEFAQAQAVDAVILWPTPRSRSLYLRHGFTPPGDLLELRRDRGPR
ncbi:MAG TPA: GNAT family N-acetyltransferase [Terriglobales bacterium]|nr:GNAT family N-acetyltransferase [Terriglobales bacterium]